MTCVLAMVEKGTSYLGTDGRESYGDGTYEDNIVQGKFMDLNCDDMLAAYAGDTAVGQICEDVALSLPALWDNGVHYRSVRNFANNCRLRIKNIQGDPEEGKIVESEISIVIVTAGKIFNINDNWAVLEPRKFCATGDAGLFAYGQLLAYNSAKPKWTAIKKIEKSIEGAIENFNSCGYPIDIREI